MTEPTKPAGEWTIDECRTYAREARQQAGRVLDNLGRLFDLIGAEAGRCRGCGKSILWIKTKTGKSCPLDPDGAAHFGTCPHAGHFSGKGKAGT